MWETWVRSLGREDPLEKEMATHSSLLAWRIPWTEEPGGLHSPRGRKESDTTEQLHFHFQLRVKVKVSWTYLVTQLVKNPPAMRETWVRSLGWEDPLEKGKATHSSILAWRIPWTV